MNTPNDMNPANEICLDFVGIGVSKESLEFALRGVQATQSFSNDSKGIKRLLLIWEPSPSWAPP